MDRSDDRLLHILMIAIPTGMMGAMFWLGHLWATAKQRPDLYQTIGGLMLAGFVAWTGCMLLMASGLPAELASPIAAIIGASGERGYEYFFNRATEKQ